GGADQGGDPVLRDLQRDVLEGAELAVVEGDVVERDLGRRGSRQRPQHGRRTGEGFLRSLPVNGPRLFLGFFHRGSIAHLTLTAVYRGVKSQGRPRLRRGPFCVVVACVRRANAAGQAPTRGAS